MGGGHIDDAERVVDAIRDAIVRAVSPKRVVLFGSHARGGARPDSDYDLLLVVDTDRPTWEVGIDARLAAAHIPVPMDFIVLTPRELEEELAWPSSVVVEALRTGRVIHEAPE
jgi:predicted nucleotidyltransferase